MTPFALLLFSQNARGFRRAQISRQAEPSPGKMPFITRIPPATGCMLGGNMVRDCASVRHPSRSISIAEQQLATTQSVHVPIEMPIGPPRASVPASSHSTRAACRGCRGGDVVGLRESFALPARRQKKGAPPPGTHHHAQDGIEESFLTPSHGVRVPYPYSGAHPVLIALRFDLSTSARPPLSYLPSSSWALHPLHHHPHTPPHPNPYRGCGGGCVVVWCKVFVCAPERNLKLPLDPRRKPR